MGRLILTLCRSELDSTRKRPLAGWGWPSSSRPSGAEGLACLENRSGNVQRAMSVALRRSGGRSGLTYGPRAPRSPRHGAEGSHIAHTRSCRRIQPQRSWELEWVSFTLAMEKREYSWYASAMFNTRPRLFKVSCSPAARARSSSAPSSALWPTFRSSS